ncbi:glycoside hydrolase family 3 [Paenibacillus sp. MWE-103]|uniref:beta-N-acetylhexosaminidase n=1 Tax=Paenibacillus artemisiicola TaxID=1172618 RepID=A0ABS3W8M0_9BACL|nr:glycoside hydrolase family 3 protein [Paenibacillus artemisiicola]MBO7744646.1 glycoside hydrolase family 3 [Paenibacillus artemisiicola]
MEAIPLRAKIGQLIVTGFPAAAMTGDLKRLIRDYKIGNIILFSPNAANKTQLGALCAELQRTIAAETGHPALIAIDQEGGRVARLPADASNAPGAMAIAATGRPENAYAAGRLTARELRALGINFNLAPVLDINNNKANPVINVRSYGDAAETVEAYALPMMRGLRDEGVLAAVKHFPGHGDTAVDSHLGLPVIGKTLAELRELELKPFRAAIAAGAEAIMSSHILFPRIEAERVPATMSRTIVTDLLKRELGFDGLVVSDCLEMDAIKRYYGTARGALGALKAGVHLLFVSHTPALVMETSELIERAVASGELAESVIDDALAKVLAVKAKYAAAREPGGEAELAVVGSDVHRRAVSAMSMESICLVAGGLRTVRKGGGDAFFVGTLPYRTDRASSGAKAGLSFPAAMGAAFGAPIAEVGIDPGEAEIARTLALAAGCAHVVVGLYNGRENPGQLKLVERLAADGRAVTAVALGKPYDLEALPAGVCGLAAFEYTPLALDSLIAVLGGDAEPTGRIPLAGFAGAAR